MPRLRYLITLILGLTFLFFLGCDANEQKAPEGPQESTTAPEVAPLKLGICISPDAAPWAELLAAELVGAVSNVQGRVTRLSSETPKKDVMSLIAGAPDIILLATADDEGWESTLYQAFRRKIYVLTLGQPLSVSDKNLVTAHIGFDNCRPDPVVVGELAKRFPGKGVLEVGERGLLEVAPLYEDGRLKLLGHQLAGDGREARDTTRALWTIFREQAGVVVAHQLPQALGAVEGLAYGFGFDADGLLPVVCLEPSSEAMAAFTARKVFAVAVPAEPSQVVLFENLSRLKRGLAIPREQVIEWELRFHP